MYAIRSYYVQELGEIEPHACVQGQCTRLRSEQCPLLLPLLPELPSGSGVIEWRGLRGTDDRGNVGFSQTKERFV